MIVPSARTLSIAGFAVVLLVVLATTLRDEGGDTDAAPQPLSDNRATAPSDAPVVDVKLEALQQDRLGILTSSICTSG